jgi:Cu2+-exporting ATPase
LENITGKGVKGYWPNGSSYLAGNLLLMQEHHIVIDEQIAKYAENWLQHAYTLVYFANHERVLGLVAIHDPLKPGSADAIQALQKTGIKVHILTGDNQNSAQAVAKAVGVNEYRASALPDDKLHYISQLKAQGSVVAMVGDGINDAPALAGADLSIAMGKGTDIAMDVAKVTLISSDLRMLAKVFYLSSRTVATIRQNLFWAFIYNLIGIPLAAGILYPFNGFLLNPMLAGAAMALSSVSVVSNSLRLRNIKMTT